MVAVGFVGYLLLATGIPALVAPGTVIAFGFGWGLSGLFWYATLRAYPQSSGSLTRMVIPGNLIRWPGWSFVFGVVAELASYRAAWLVAALWALAGAAAMRTCACVVAEGLTAQPAEA